MVASYSVKFWLSVFIIEITHATIAAATRTRGARRTVLRDHLQVKFYTAWT